MNFKAVRGPIARHYFNDNQVHAAIATTVLMIAAAVVVALAPSLRSRAGAATLAERMPDRLAALLGVAPDLSFDTAAGHLDAWFLSLAAPLVLCALALPAAVRSIAGCEATGEMEWLAAQPVERAQIVFERFVAIAFVTVQAATPATIILVLGGGVGGLELEPGMVVWSMLRVVVLVSVEAGTVVMVSGLTGSLDISVGVAIAAPIVAFGLILGGDSSARLSPVRWVLGEAPAAEGDTTIGVLMAVIVLAACILIGSAGFQRRDIVL